MSEAAKTGEVVDFSRKAPLNPAAQALGMSLVQNVPGDRQVTFQCFIASDESLEAQNALIDRMALLAERQRAKGEAVQLVAEVEKREAVIARYGDDKARIDHEHEVAQAKRTVEMSEWLSQAETAEREGYDEHVKGGRRGAYVPSGGRKQRIDAFKAQAKKVEESIAAANAEREKHLSNHAVILQQHTEDLDKARFNLQRLERLIG